MTVTNDMIFDVLHTIQSDVSPLRESVAQLNAQAAVIKDYMVSTQQDMMRIYEKLALHELRIALLERHNAVMATKAG
jgi:hypothetical protein